MWDFLVPLKAYVGSEPRPPTTWDIGLLEGASREALCFHLLNVPRETFAFFISHVQPLPKYFYILATLAKEGYILPNALLAASFLIYSVVKVQ